MKFPRPRILPFAIVFTLTGIGFRTVDMVSLAVSGQAFTTISTAQAEPAKTAAEEAKPDDKAKPTAANAEVPQPGLPSHPPLTATEDSKAATDVLAEIAEKRKQLDAQTKELDQKQALLQAAETRIDRKVDELSSMRGDMEKLLDIQKTKDDAQIASLVKIYENMKAKDAAVIFDNLELPVLVDLTSRMKEGKLAPILAAMSPEHARILTVKLSEHRKNMEGAVADAKAALNEGAPAQPAATAPATLPRPDPCFSRARLSFGFLPLQSRLRHPRRRRRRARKIPWFPCAVAITRILRAYCSAGTAR